MPITQFPIQSTELSIVASSVRSTINAMENTNSAVNTKISEDAPATTLALNPSAGGGGALDAGKLIKFDAGGGIPIGQGINVSTENATVTGNDFIGISAASTPNQTRKSKLSTLWNYIKSQIESSQIQLGAQSVVNGNSALNVSLGDSRYNRFFHNVNATDPAITSSSTTPTKVATITLPTGIYQLDAAVSSNHSLNVGCIITLRASSLIKYTLFDTYGRPLQSPVAETIASDSSTSTSRSDAGGTGYNRMIQGVVEIITNNTELSLEYSQAVADGAKPSTCRKRPYIIARRLS